MRKNKTEILKWLAPLKIWAGDTILAPTYIGSMTWPMRERQSQAAPTAQQARQARHPRLKGSHFITICEIKCSVAENSANNSCSAFFFKLLAVKNPLVSSLIVELKHPSVGFNTFSAHISTKPEKLPYFARIKTGPLRPLYCPDRPKHPTTLLKRQLSSFRAGFVRNKHIAPQMWNVRETDTDRHL